MASRSNKEAREAKGLKLDPKTYDPLKELPDSFDPVAEAKRRAKLNQSERGK